MDNERSNLPFRLLQASHQSASLQNSHVMHQHGKKMCEEGQATDSQAL